MSDPPRRGWRETVEPGLYRSHRVACPSSTDRRPGRRCSCPWQVQVPGVRTGTTRFVTVHGTVGEARTQRRRLLAAGRPADAATVEPGTLDGLAGDYFRARAPVLAANTIRNREDDYRRRISPELGGLDLAEVTRQRVEVWLAGLVARAPSRRMVVQTVATLRVILRAAVEWGLLAENPAARLRLPHPTAEDQAAVARILDADQLERLIAAAGSTRTESMFRAAGEAGLRRGEVAGLRWGDVALDERRLMVQRNVTQERRTSTEAMRKIEAGPKGGRARRVAISATFARRLADWYAESVVEGGADATGYVWPGKDGGPMHDRSLARALERTCERGGLVDEEERPLVSPHGLRHSAAAIMLGAGVPLIVVSRQLGHANPHITATVYAHLLGDAQLDSAAQVFDRSEAASTMRETMREAAGAS